MLSSRANPLISSSLAYRKRSLTIQIGKEFYYQVIDIPFRQRFVLNSEVMTRLSITGDALEGINAFIEKRPPVWEGK